MKTKHWLLITLLSIGFNLFAQDQAVSTYYLIRHAEKEKTGGSNPALTEEGKARAEKWAEIFRNIKFDEIYSTEFTRTWETVKPTAEKQGLEIHPYDPVLIDAAKFKEDTKGKTILIVGHSNTIPGFVNDLIGKDKYKDIEESNNGNLYIVEIIGDIATDKVLYLN